MPTQHGSLARDDNESPIMGGTSNVDNKTIINSSFDPITRRLLTTGSGGSSSITVTDGVTTVNNVTTLDFTSGATVTAGATGTADIAITGGSGSPGGSNTDVQFNNSGAFGGSNDFQWLSGSQTLSLSNSSVGLSLTGVSGEITNNGGDSIELQSGVTITASNGTNITLEGSGGGLFAVGDFNSLGSDQIEFQPAISAGVYINDPSSNANAILDTSLLTGNHTYSFPNATGTLALIGGAGVGTVTSVSVVSANGFAGTVATATSTPAITLTTSVTGVLKGNGTAISAATLGTDYSGGTSALTTGILKSTTTTGALTIAVAADFPTLNQNTTGSAATLTTARTIGTVTGDATSAGSTFDGSANNTNALTLATVNSNVGSFGSTTAAPSFTVNAKGLITAAGTNTITPAVGSITGLGTGVATFLVTPSSANLATAVTDETGSGALVFATSPTLTTAVLGSSTATTQSPSDNSTKVATTAYVDAAVLGQNFKEAALVATTANLVGVYLAGVFTYTATGTDNIDGVNLALGNRVLVKNQTTTFQNGIYTVTTAGSLGVAGVLTRSSDANTSAEFKTGDALFVTSGTVNASTTWAYTGVDSPNLGTDAITYAQIAGLGSYVAGNGLTLTGNSFSIDTSITVDKTTAQTLTNKTLTSPSITGGTLTTSSVNGVTLTTGGGTTTFLNANGAYSAPAGSGTVTTVSVTTNQGVSGTVATATTTPAITLSLGALTGVTSLNGLVVTANTGVITTGTWNGTTIAVANGGTGVTSVTTAPAATVFAGWDANKNLSANNFLEGYTTTATAGATTTLVVGSTETQYFTGTNSQTCQLPVTSTLVLGQQFHIVNNSTLLVTVNSSGGNVIVILASGTSATFTCILTTGTTAASWNSEYAGAIAASSAKLTINGAFTVTGTNATTMTFPTTSATIARTDAAQTFTGVQTFSSAPVLSTGTLTNTGTVTFFTSSDTVVGRATTDTLTNKRITRRTTTVTQAAAPAINSDNMDVASITGLAQAITSMTTNLTGTPVQNDFLEIQITDNATARAITWGTSFSAGGLVALPTTTVISTKLRVLFEWDATSKWTCVAVA